MKILYIGQDSVYSTSYHRASALRRIGNEVKIINPYFIFKNELNHFLLSKIHYRTGYMFLQKTIAEWIRTVILDTKNIDLIWIDSGELFGVNCLNELKSLNRPIILYNVDDPTGERDGNRFKSLKKSLPIYDLVVIVRDETKHECLKLGATNVLLVSRSYDEVAHLPFKSTVDIPLEFKSDVAFIGTWMRHEKRDEFILKLIESGVNVSIWGDRWEKSKNWNKLKKNFKGKSLGGRNYIAAIQGAKICIGMLSKGNRDLVTTRTFEIPYSGGLFCAERTSEHSALYEEGVEAVFWNNAEECASICKKNIV
jgi:spore maturation protein CgeB